jgi:ATP-dependent RNA helicase TDRD9
VTSFDDFFFQQIPHFNIDEPYIMEEQYEACWKLISLCDNFDKDTTTGSVLVFLPGYHEIEEMHNILLKKKLSALEWEIVPLHSSLTSDHMIKAFQKPKPGVRKIILSTNIAESSLTVPDVNYVVDFCLTKMMVVNETTKFSTLSLQWASHDNCIQRAGRVGRVANGRVYRLVPADFYNNQMQATSIPELQRAPLENIILYMKLLNLNDTPKNVLSLAISPPNFKDVEACVWHLKELGALLQTCRGVKSAADGDITFLGKIMGSLPIDIHLAKLVLLGHMFSCLEDTVIMAAGSMTRNLFVNNFHDRLKCYRKKLLWADGSCSDFITLLNLYKVWLNTKRENAFRTNNEAYAWCKTNFVNMRGLREWDLLINEINARLKRFGIERSAGVTNVQLSPVEKPTILKVIICGAFYPHYFVRSADYGQVDSREAVKMLNGRDPYNTVYLTNMKLHHPGQIYVREFKRLLNHENNPNVHIGFDGQSSKVFVEFKNVKRPERVTVDGKQYVTTILGNIAMDVYEAVRRRQLNLPLRLHVLPNHKAWQFVDSTESKRRLSISSSDEVNCYSAINYSPLPPLDIEYVTVTVTHIIDAGNFFCHNWSDETRILLSRIFAALNSGEVFLDPVEGKVKIETKMYAAVFDEDGKLYRCKVLCINPGEPPVAHVQFVDYGNTQKVHTNRLYELPKDSPECDVEPIAMRCVLSEVEPHRALDSKGLWSERVNNIFRRRTDGVLLNAKVYSVVDNVAHLELFPKNPAPNVGSFNKWLINEGHAQPLQESQRSKMDHETRRKVLNSDDPNNLSALFKSVVEVSTSYTDFEAPERSEATEVVELKGPYSPLEMKVCGLVEASLGCTVRVDGDSVNAVLLDDDPEDDHARLLVAGQVAQSAQAKTIKVSQSTLMPNIPGLPMWMTLLFCPRMEPKLTEDGTRVASILCGLGCKEYSDRANFPMHDISLVVDTELQEETIVKINELRFLMNRAVKAMNNIYDALDNPEELFPIQKRLKEQMFSLLHTKPNTVNRVNVKHANCWKRGTCADVEIMRIDIEEEEDDIWPLLWFVKLKKDSHATAAIKNNLEELVQISKG